MTFATMGFHFQVPEKNDRANKREPITSTGPANILYPLYFTSKVCLPEYFPVFPALDQQEKMN